MRTILLLLLTATLAFGQNTVTYDSATKRIKQTQLKVPSGSTFEIESGGTFTMGGSGVIPPANLGTGSSITTKFLRGDGTWQSISGTFGETSLAGLNDNQTLWDGASASRTLTLNVSGTDSVITVSSGTINVSTGAFQVAGSPVLTSSGIGVSVQAFDADLTSIAGAAGTNTIYYRSASNTWSSVSIGTSLSFSGGTLNVTGLAIGVNVQAFDSDLTTWAGVTPGTGVATALAVANNSAGGYSTIDGTATLSNKTIDSVSNTVKLKGYIYLTHPALVDGTGATMGVTSTSITYGHATFSNSADKLVNYAEYYIQIPEDIDTSVALRGRLKVLLGGADTNDQNWLISSVSVADSAVPTSSTLANEVALDYTPDASGANGDVETTAWTTLTNWASALTAGQTWRIRLMRDGDTSDASTVNSTELGLVIEYGITQ
jgi:hypothetical protein